MTVPQMVPRAAGRGGGQGHRHHRGPRPLPARGVPRGVAVWDRSRIDEAQRTLRRREASPCSYTTRSAPPRTPQAQAGQDRPAAGPGVDQRADLRGLRGLRAQVQLPVGAAGADRVGRKTGVHQSSCNVDYSCLDGDCPAFMTVVPGLLQAAPGVRKAISSEELRCRARSWTKHSFGIRLTGSAVPAWSPYPRSCDRGLIASWHTRSLDQIGLAQKGGAVVSDVRFSRSARRPQQARRRGVRPLPGVDLLVAADPKNLAVTTADRTVAVVSVAKVPTGPMVSDPALAFPDRGAISQPIMDRVRDGSVLLDVRRISSGCSVTTSSPTSSSSARVSRAGRCRCRRTPSRRRSG